MSDFKIGVRALVIAAGLAAPTGVWAQQAGPTPTPSEPVTTAQSDQVSQLDEIVVTAQKRNESVNDVPLSVNAARGEELLNRGITDPSELGKIAPGFVFTKSINGTPLFSLRGVGFNDYTLGSSPAVSVYVDEVPLAFSTYVRGASLDLDRVEVLKGPQGILFGQNATGGAINYIAAKPTQTFASGFDATYGRFNALEASGYVSGALAPTLSARLSLGATQSGDWQKSFTRDDTLGSQDVLRGRAQLLWEPTDRLSVLLSANGWRDQSDTQAAQYIALRPQRAVGSASTAVEVARRNAALRAMPLAPADARAADWTQNEPLRRDDWFYQLSARADYTLTEAITLTSISAYSRYRENYSVDRDGMSLIDIGSRSNGRVESLSQELRIAGDYDRIRWLAGANYSKDDSNQTVTALTTDSTNTIIISGLPITVTPATLNQHIKQSAVFGNLEVGLTDTLTALVGGRYTQSRNVADYCQGGDFNFRQTITLTSTALSGSPTPLIQQGECASLDTTGKPVRTPFPGLLDEDNTSWRVGLNYKPDDDKLFYASISRGFKSGSFPVLSASSILQIRPVVQESVTATEVGFKVGALDNRVQVNGALFRYDYDNKQVRAQIVIPLFNRQEALVNVPKSRITGAEIEVVARPIDGLRLALNGTYVDSEVRDYVGINLSSASQDFAGEPLPYSPKYQVNGSVDYSASLTEGMDWYASGSIRYNSEASALIGAPAELQIKAFTTVDLTAGVEASSGAWRFGVYGRNIFDEYYWTNAFVSQDALVRYAAMPATYGVALRLRY